MAGQQGTMRWRTSTALLCSSAPAERSISPGQSSCWLSRSNRRSATKRQASRRAGLGPSSLLPAAPGQRNPQRHRRQHPQHALPGPTHAPPPAGGTAITWGLLKAAAVDSDRKGHGELGHLCARGGLALKQTPVQSSLAWLHSGSSSGLWLPARK